MNEKNPIRESIRQVLHGKEESKKQISLVIESDLLRALDVITESFKQITKGRISSRNQLIELGIAEYVKEASFVLLNDYGINVEELLAEDEPDVMDSVSSNDTEELVAIFPAKEPGFRKVFLEEKQWYSVRLAEWRINKIKYVACYRTAPYSEITHYAKVKEIVPFDDSGKYKIILSEAPKPLARPIKRGANDTTGVRARWYTTLDKLFNAKELSDL